MLTHRSPGVGQLASVTHGVQTSTVTGRQVSLFQRNSDGASVIADGKASAGGRATGAVVLGGKGAPSRAVYHRDFWRMAPKKLETDAAAGTVTLAYWPVEAGAMSFLPLDRSRLVGGH